MTIHNMVLIQNHAVYLYRFMHKVQTYPWELQLMITRTREQETKASCLAMQQMRQRILCPCQFCLHTSLQSVLPKQERAKNFHGQDLMASLKLQWSMKEASQSALMQLSFQPSIHQISQTNRLEKR